VVKQRRWVCEECFQEYDSREGAEACEQADRKFAMEPPETCPWCDEEAERDCDCGAHVWEHSCGHYDCGIHEKEYDSYVSDEYEMLMRLRGVEPLPWEYPGIGNSDERSRWLLVSRRCEHGQSRIVEGSPSVCLTLQCPRYKETHNEWGNRVCVHGEIRGGRLDQCGAYCLLYEVPEMWEVSREIPAGEENRGLAVFLRGPRQREVK